LLLAIATLIFIRNRSAAVNTPATSQQRQYQDDFPDEIEADITQDDRTGRRFTRTGKSDSERQSLISGDSFDRNEARKKLLEHLKLISHYHPGRWFRADLIDGGVLIRLFRRQQGIEETIAETRQSDKLLRAVDRPDFPERLIDELIRREFPIDKDKVSL
jgi:hypothetical protein